MNKLVDLAVDALGFVIFGGMAVLFLIIIVAFIKIIYDETWK